MKKQNTQNKSDSTLNRCLGDIYGIKFTCLEILKKKNGWIMYAQILKKVAFGEKMVISYEIVKKIVEDP